MAAITELVSTYVYMPSQERGSTSMTTYHSHGKQAYNLAWVERFAAKELKTSDPRSNPLSVKQLESIAVIIYKYVAKDSYGRDANCAHIILSENDIFKMRGLSYPRLFLAAKDPDLLKKLDTHGLTAISEDNLKSYMGGGANVYFYGHLLAAAGLLDANGFLEIEFNQAERYNRLVPFLASVFSLMPRNGYALPYIEYNTDSGCIAQIGTLEKKLSNTLLGGPPKIDLNSDHVPNVRSEFYEALLAGMQKHIFADTALRSIGRGHELAHHFGREKLIKFVNEYDNIRIDFYGAIDTAIKTNLFSGDVRQATQKCYGLAEVIGQEKFISFVHNHSAYSGRYGAVVRSMDKLPFKDTQKALYTYHKMAEFFGESKTEEFFESQRS